jgi:hypothetical protein
MKTKKVQATLTVVKRVVLEIPIGHDINNVGTRTFCYNTLEGLDKVNHPLEKVVDFDLQELGGTNESA